MLKRFTWHSLSTENFSSSYLFVGRVWLPNGSMAWAYWHMNSLDCGMNTRKKAPETTGTSGYFRVIGRLKKLTYYQYQRLAIHS
jgi:hypothetical protein